MAFTPENRLEEAIVLAASQPEARGQFYRALLDHEVTVIGTIGDSMMIDTVRHEGRLFHPIFSAPSRLKAGHADDRAHFTMQGRVLFEATRGASFILNLGSEVGKMLEPPEIDHILSVARADDGQRELVIGEPRVYPRKLVQACCVLFMSRSLVRAAYLTHVMRKGLDTEPRPLIGIEADGEVPRLAQEIFAVAAAALPNTAVDVVAVNRAAISHPLQRHPGSQ